MSRFLGVVIAICLVVEALGHGKEHRAPKLSPAVLASLHTTPTPHQAKSPAQHVHTCLPGYELRDDDECVKQIEEPAILACKEGTAVDGQCEIKLPKVLTCPQGFKLHGDKCTRIVEVGIQFYCPLGFYDDGSSCAKEIPGEAAIQCDLGELVGDQCITRHRTEHIIASRCPEGSELEPDGTCWKTVETFDCSKKDEEKQTTVLSRPKDHNPLGKKVIVTKGKTKPFRSLIGKLPPTPEPFVPVQPPPPPPKVDPSCGTEMISVTAPRPTRVSVVSQVCNKRIQVDAIALVSCPPEYFDNGNYCEKETTTIPTTVCISGDHKDGVCKPAIKRVPKYPGCPKESYAARGKCWKEEKVDPIESCPNTFVDGGEFCLGYVESPGYECPEGLELHGNVCIGEVIRPVLHLKVEAPETCNGRKY